jgi:GNAT superfamily N-acetyltransferase
MTDPAFFEAIDGTWPAAHLFQSGPWTLRDGQGGGQRVSATTSNGPVSEKDIDDAEAGMVKLGQPRLFMIRDTADPLDTMLSARGYSIVDPVTLYACPVAHLTDLKLPRVTVFEIWEPLAIMLEIWETGGIGPGRVAVMKRAAGPKTTLLGRLNEHPAAAAYVAIHDGIAMVHAVEVLKHQQRQGMGHWIMRAAAFWASKHGAHTLSVMCTDANAGANGLYTSLGMPAVGHYHYRRLIA